MARDGDVSWQLATLLIDGAPNRDRCQAMLPVPPNVTCRSEVSLHSSGREGLGRVDLQFQDDAGDFTLMVELKIHSPYGHDQIDRYSQALRRPRGRRSGLMAVTRNLPTAGEPPRSTEGWLGSARWMDIYEKLAGLDIQNDELGRQWRLLVRLIYEQETSA